MGRGRRAVAASSQVRRAAKVDAAAAANRNAAAQKAVGLRAGKLVVIAYFSGTKRIKSKAEVRCDCGTVKVIDFGCVRDGVVGSCGCIKRAVVIARSTRHGRVGTPEHNTWLGMKERCNNPNAHNYRWYGAKGVTVCARWNDSFEAFFADMGSKPTPLHSLDRINPFGNYEPSNCRWATKKEQSANQRGKVAAAR